MQTKYYNLIYGFAIFSMFFGSGNLVFPLEIGHFSANYWFVGFVGLFLTGIILPFMGLFVIKLHKGSYDGFFSQAGPLARIILPLFTLSLLGTFGIVPRCITVAHGGLVEIIPSLSLPLFSILFCIISFIVGLREGRMITIIGKWMTPLLLVSISILILLAIMNSPPAPGYENSISKTFNNGFLVGYQTMDLFAAFFFSALIFRKIQNDLPSSASTQQVIRASLKPSFIGAGLLSLVYLAFVYMGAYYGNLFSGVSPELYLPKIALFVLGEYAAFIIGLIVVLACFTTAVALNNIYAQYLSSTFRVKEKYYPIVLSTTTGGSFLISLLDFRGIASFLAPALEVSYPSIIFLTLLSILTKGYQRIKIMGFYIILFVMILWSINWI